MSSSQTGSGLLPSPVVLLGAGSTMTSPTVAQGNGGCRHHLCCLICCLVALAEATTADVSQRLPKASLASLASLATTLNVCRAGSRDDVGGGQLLMFRLFPSCTCARSCSGSVLASPEFKGLSEETLALPLATGRMLEARRQIALKREKAMLTSE